MQSTSSGKPDPVGRLQDDASKVMQELSDLSAKLRTIGKESAEKLADETVAELQSRLGKLQEEARRLGSEGEKLFASLDRSVREHPWAYVLGALGLGYLLGKARRS